jgi:ribonuclease BN (tRNA processing enzyme)
MEVIFLGTGDAFASGGRNHMAILLRTSELGVLLDCGPTTLTALKQSSLTPDDVDVVLLSHHHGDHYGGLPFLILDGCYVGSRKKRLRVLGPAGTRSIVPKATTLFFAGLEPFPFELELQDLEPLQPIALPGLEVLAFPVDHYTRGTAFGYRVRAEGKTVVFSGDTAWTEILVEQTAGADLFICECSSFDRSLEKHMSHRDLERNGDRLGARRTILVHAGEDVLARTDELVFELAHDNMRVTL